MTSVYKKRQRIEVSLFSHFLIYYQRDAYDSQWVTGEWLPRCNSSWWSSNSPLLVPNTISSWLRLWYYYSVHYTIQLQCLSWHETVIFIVLEWLNFHEWISFYCHRLPIKVSFRLPFVCWLLSFLHFLKGKIYFKRIKNTWIFIFKHVDRNRNMDEMVFVHWKFSTNLFYWKLLITKKFLLDGGK